MSRWSRLLFFAAGALLLAMVGLYGVLDYSLLQRRREIGIRIAIGTRATDVGALALPSAIILAVALLASLPTMIRAVRIDPVTMLRSE